MFRLVIYMHISLNDNYNNLFEHNDLDATPRTTRCDVYLESQIPPYLMD